MQTLIFLMNHPRAQELALLLTGVLVVFLILLAAEARLAELDALRV